MGGFLPNTRGGFLNLARPTRSSAPAAPILGDLGGTFTLAEDATQGATAGTLTGRTTGSTLSLQDSAGNRVQLDGLDIERGATELDYESATSHEFTIRETLAGAANSPHDTVLTINVTNVEEGLTILDTEIVTVGTVSDWLGFANGAFGSCDDGQFAPQSNASISGLVYYPTGFIPLGVSAQSLVFAINTAPLGDDGFTTMAIDGMPFARANAEYTFTDPGAQWLWTGVTESPFAEVGQDSTVEFT